MPLDYLLFDFTDEESGCGSFDAMASVRPDRWDALVAEVEAVLGWAHRAFGAPSGSDEHGEWDFELQATTDADLPFPVSYEAGREQVRVAQAPRGRITLTLTISGSRTFCDAFREAFPGSD